MVLIYQVMQSGLLKEVMTERLHMVVYRDTKPLDRGRQ